MIRRRDIELPAPRAFYETEYDFEVVVDRRTCGSFTLGDGGQFSLAPSAVLAPTLAALGSIHRASVSALSEASLRFYRTGGVSPFALSEYLSILFLTQYEWGLAFTRSAANSIERVADSSAVYHFEAGRRHSEMFAYGLAVHFTASLLGIPIDRLFFISASGARPDFRARVSLAELMAAGTSIGGLTASGAIVELEVKALLGWASFRADGRQGKLLLKNLADKVSNRGTRTHLCVGIALPALSPTIRTKTRILIADPGDSGHLGERDQTILLLEEALVLLLRHGLWPTLANALGWLRQLRGSLTDHESELDASVARYHGMRQYRLVTIQQDGRSFNGRVFNDVLDRLGHVGQRGMSRDEAEERLRTDSLGNNWYSGVDADLTNIIAGRDLRGLLSFGVNELRGGNLAGRSAYYHSEYPMNDAERHAVRGALSSALAPHRW